jgi:hypothetical protein
VSGPVKKGAGSVVLSCTSMCLWHKEKDMLMLCSYSYSSGLAGHGVLKVVYVCRTGSGRNPAGAGRGGVCTHTCV